MGRRDCRRAMGRLRSGEGGASDHGRVKEISRRDAELAQSVKGLVSGRVPIPFSAFQSPKQQSHNRQFLCCRLADGDWTLLVIGVQAGAGG